ncbi:shikimate 5-dehydrogenase [Hymenobacter qilianensis]|uniref:Shikimate 5-dehydrogenase n=2 Tax=Hymenobacter qilianensis TaxID=1385715 RepID=A0ACB5PMB6_9BACT|nr:shikimate dehydrogenase [Hymenobacter qilianensis]QNP53820.1 shikimate dehydrogenase [Hymenobacter qilianensis]GGF52742.1 shikimate 5-dehydrogenase [Hymenobacter qilianensis]
MKEFGLIGKSLVHSFSQTYFTQKFENLGLDDHHYELFELPTISALPELLAEHPSLRGLNVTIPYKEQIWPYLSEISSAAARIGAINVIDCTPDGRYIGHNTDYIGFRESLRAFYPLRGAAARALVLGTGGSSKAVEAALRELEIPYWLVSRNPLGTGLTYNDLTPDVLVGHSLIINATPLGTFPQVDACAPIPYEALTPAHYLYDLIYNPSETLFLQKGREAGAQTKNGFEMLCLQAEAAWEIWSQ